MEIRQQSFFLNCCDLPCSEDNKTPSFVFHPLGHSRVRNKDITTTIVGGIQRGGGCKSTYCALASLDGKVQSGLSIVYV